MAHEINLVPDIKNDMIKSLKLRNLIFFLCIVVSASAAGLTFLFGTIAGGQSLAIEGKKEELNILTKKTEEYNDLGNFLTIQNQTDQLGVISQNKTVLSRIFNVIGVFNPSNGDKLNFSEMTVDLKTSVLSFEAQANALQRNGDIDYNVLDALKKSMDYLTYDYGKYVDKKGAEIPVYCMIDTNPEGTFLIDSNKNLYAYWAIERDGCNPSDNNEESEKVEYSYDEYNGEKVIKIWRTPRFKEWEAEGYLSKDGEISNIEHFDSKCITYYKKDNGEWDKDTNAGCMLVPEKQDGFIVKESSNGQLSDGDTVLRFAGTITLNKEIFKFTNSHLIPFGPNGKYNVTDSYVQIQNMFKERAADCDPDNIECNAG